MSDPMFFDDNLNVFSQAQLEVLRGFINKLPLNKHYLMFYQTYDGSSSGDVSSITYYIVVFGEGKCEAEFSYSDFNGISISDSAIVYQFLFRDSDLSNGPWLYCRDILRWENIQFSYNASESRWFYFADNVDTGAFSWGPCSDLFSDVAFANNVGVLAPVSDISNRGEVKVQYATFFSLVVFFVYDRLRALWRSIRGRDT